MIANLSDVVRTTLLCHFSNAVIFEVFYCFNSIKHVTFELDQRLRLLISKLCMKRLGSVMESELDSCIYR